MTTPTNNSPVGTSRLLGTNDAQRAVDSLTRQVTNLERAIAQAVGAFQSMSNGAHQAASNSGSGRWNMQSNFPRNNGGRGTFSGTNQTGAGGGGGGGGTTRQAGNAPNGGNGGRFGPGTYLMLGAGRSNGSAGSGGFSGGSAFSYGLAAAAGAARGLVNYGNRTMSSNMQMDMFGNYAALAGGIPNGGYQSANNVAMRTTFANNRIALNANDAARGGYTAAYTFGSPQFNGQTNSAYTQGVRQASGFAFASPTIGFSGAMTAAQQTYTARSLYATQMYGLTPAFGMHGQRATMGQIAQSMIGRTFQGRSRVSQKELDAALAQGGSLAVNLQAYGQSAGWNQTTVQSYENYIRGLNAAQNKGMTQTEYDRLTQTAATGSGASKRNALAKLKETTGLGASMFERQRDLNATRLTRQEDILEHLAPAFEKATDMVNRFSQALTDFLKATGLNSAIGFGSGSLTPFSNALGGLGGGFGMVGGGLLAARLFGGSGGFLGGLFGRGAASGAGGMINATRGAGGAYNITSAGRAAMSGGSLIGGLSTAGALFLAQGHSGGGLYNDYTSRKGKGGFSKQDEIKYVMQWAKENRAEGQKKGWLDKQGLPKNYEDLKKKLNVTENLTAIAQAQGDGRMTPTDGISGGAGEGTSSGKKSGSGGGAQGAGNANAATIIKYAQQQLGDPYVWGGTGPDGWDCSGLLQWAYGQAGVKIPRTSQEQQKIGKAVPTDAVQPGDLLFNGNPAHHVVMAIGGGKIIEAPRTGLKVRIRGFKPGEFTNARRIVGSVGNMSDITTDGKTTPTTLNDQGSTIGGNIGGGYGGTSELAALMSALSGGIGGASPGAVSSGPSGSGGATAGDDVGTAVDSGDYNWGAINGKVTKVPAPPGWVKAAIQRGMSAKGVSGASWARGLTTIAFRESGYKADSRNDWDSNAKNGDPSVGLFQVIGSTFKAYRSKSLPNSQTDPAASAAAAIGWIKARYGNIDKVQQANANRPPKGYASGAWNIDQDQAAQIHKGEMILPAKQAESVRNAITNTLTTGSSTSGTGIVFQQGSIVVNPQGPMTQQEAKMTGKMIVDAVMEDKRIKEMQKGH